jgi:hypothetical protein
VNVAPTVQLAPAASDVVHVPVATAKSAVLVPVNVGGIVKGMEDVVLFVSVTNCAEVGVPTNCVPKLMLAGDTESVGISGKSATYAFVAPAAPRDV